MLEETLLAGGKEYADWWTIHFAGGTFNSMPEVLLRAEMNNIDRHAEEVIFGQNFDVIEFDSITVEMWENRRIWLRGFYDQIRHYQGPFADNVLACIRWRLYNYPENNHSLPKFTKRRHPIPNPVRTALNLAKIYDQPLEETND